MTVIKKEDWKNSGRSVKNYPPHNSGADSPDDSIRMSNPPNKRQALTQTNPTESDAVDTLAAAIASHEADRKAFEAELVELKKETLDAAYISGFETGKTEGFQAGSTEALTHYQADSAALLAAINTLSSEKTNLVENAQADLIALASKIARRLLACELTLNPAVITHIVSEALAKITDKSTVIIRVHPDNLPPLQADQATLKELMPDIQTLQLDSDPTIEPGGCMIETSLGYIDATVATKLKSLSLAIQTVDRPPTDAPDSDSDSEAL